VLEELWLHHSRQSLVAVMYMPPRSYIDYAAPRELYLNVSLPAPPHGPSSEKAHIVEVELIWIGKHPTLGGEASVLSFQPAPALWRTPQVMRWQEAQAKSGGLIIEQQRLAASQQRTEASAWRFNKVGSDIDPEDVVDGGGQFCHGVWGGVAARTERGIFRVESLDTATVSPIGPGCPKGCLLPAVDVSSTSVPHPSPRWSPGSVVGAAVNLHNNLWSSNYPVFYPYYDPRFCAAPDACADSNLRFRFRLHLGGSQQWGSTVIVSGGRKKKESLDPLALAAVLFVGGAAVLLGLRALHYENSGELLLDDLQDLEPDDSRFQMFAHRSLNHRSSVRGAGLGGLDTINHINTLRDQVIDMRLSRLSLNERYSHMS
jgi:hypothetical protein